jgi:hypothetical protein
MTRPLPLLTAAAALAALIAAAPRPASACGGTFCDGTPGPQVMSVDQSGESIAFVMEDGWVEAHVQIEYRGDPAQFAWIVPVLAEPEVSVGSQAMFDRLLAATVPTFTVDTRFEGDCSSDRSSRGCVSYDAAPASGDDGFIDQDEPPGEPNVLAQDLVGAYEYTVLQGGTVDGIGQWLDDNGYARDDEAPKILQAYLDEGFLFVAFKLRAGTGLDQIHPVVLRYQGDEPCIPLRLTRVAAIEDMKVRAFFLGDTRVVPTNYRHVELNPLRIDWSSLGANYDDLVSEAVDQEGADGRAFVTEYAGPSSIVSRAGLRGLGWRSEAFLDTTAATLTDTLNEQGLITCGFTSDEDTGGGDFEVECGATHPLLVPLLRTYFPPPTGVFALDFYQCTSCYAVDESMWDPAGFVEGFEEQIVEPAEHASDVLTGNPFLTRLYTMISPGEMSIDPLFHEHPGLATVSNQWSATNVIHCEDPDRYDLNDGRSIYLDDSGRSDFEGMSAAVRITEIAMAGAPMVLLDATEAIDSELADWNAAHGPTNADCECRSSRRGMEGAGWLGLLLLLGLRVRSRRR